MIEKIYQKKTLEDSAKWWKDYCYSKSEVNIDLEHPKTFSDKTAWCYVYTNVLYNIEYGDKATSKDVVKNIIGDEYIIPTYGIYNDVEEIDFNSLPNSFVAKTTISADSNNIFAIKDKNKTNIQELKEKIKLATTKTGYFSFYNALYKPSKIQQKIIIEKHIDRRVNGAMLDYKFWVLDGKVVFIDLQKNFAHKLTTCVVDKHFNKLNVDKSYWKDFKKTIKKPKNFEKMVEIAEKLATGLHLPCIRVDLYNVNGKIYFGELTQMTAYHTRFTDKTLDFKLGQMIDLHKIDKKYLEPDVVIPD